MSGRMEIIPDATYYCRKGGACYDGDGVHFHFAWVYVFGADS